MESFLFLLKKLISSLLLPVGFVVFLNLLAIILWRRRPGGRAGPLLVVVAGLTLLVLSMPLTGRYLLRDLESRAGARADPGMLAPKGVKHIVVLSGGMKGRFGPADSLGDSTLKRVLEGIRLKKGLMGSFLVLSGGSFDSDWDSAKVMADFCVEAGLDRNSLILETSSWDTEDQARLLKPLLGESAFVLVTSAFHMPRSMTIFKRYGLHPIPAPADFHVANCDLKFTHFLPGTKGLRYSETALKEYLGLAWYGLKDLWRPRELPATDG